MSVFTFFSCGGIDACWNIFLSLFWRDWLICFILTTWYFLTVPFLFVMTRSLTSMVVLFRVVWLDFGWFHHFHSPQVEF